MRWSILFVVAALLSACAMSGGERLPRSPGVQIAAVGLGLGDGGAPLRPHLEEDRIVARDGTALPLRQWLPEGEPAAVVLALHGFNDYSNAFADAGDAFAKAGIATFAYDQRGFGRAADRGRWAGEREMTDDAATAAMLLRQRYPGVPLYLLGESMGGAVAILASTGRGGAPRADVDGVILVAPAVWGRQTMGVLERIGLWFADLMPAVKLSADLLPMTVRPSDNLRMLRAYSADPLVIRDTRADSLSGLVDLMSEALIAAPRFDAPALVLYGQHDEIVPRDPVARFVDRLPARAAAQQRVALYPEGYHMLMRDLEGPLVIADVAAWIKAPRAPLPSGADHDGRGRLLGRPASLATAAR
jgi:alpha-beta hydrolase superfamily lysophospholipase